MEATANETLAVSDEEIAERRKERLAMVEELKGCLSGLDIDLDQAREERINRKGVF